MHRAVCLCLLLGAAPAALAQPAGPGDSGKSAASEAAEASPGSQTSAGGELPGPVIVLQPGQSYRGVAPGAPHLPPRAKRPSRRGPVRLTWIGFQVREGVPTVFVELTRAARWRVIEGGEALVVQLETVTIPLKNNRRPLQVAEFSTAVKQVVARPQGRDVEIHIRLAHAVSHRERIEDAMGGYKLLLIELF